MQTSSLNSRFRVVLTAAMLLLTAAFAASGSALAQNGFDDSKKAKTPEELAREVIAKAIQTLGGDAYLRAKTQSSNGNWFAFDRHGRRSGLVKYWEDIHFDPLKWRFQRGKGGRQVVQVYNLEVNKGWRKEGKSYVEELPEDRVESFRKSARHDLNILLKVRANEEGNRLFYYGPDDITGDGSFEAIEFLDEANDSTIVYFKRYKDYLPARVEYTVTDAEGNRHKTEEEFYNWHKMDGVLVPMRIDISRNGQVIEQRHAYTVTVNQPIPSSRFLKPPVKDD